MNFKRIYRALSKAKAGRTSTSRVRALRIAGQTGWSDPLRVRLISMGLDSPLREKTKAVSRKFSRREIDSTAAKMINRGRGSSA